jgi:hypothetical protein
MNAMRVLLFFSCLFACLLYALWRGGWPERAGALVITVGALLTLALYSPAATRFNQPEVYVLAVDVAVLAAYVWRAISTDRYWPLWTAALQLIGVLAHVAKLADPVMLRNGYAFLVAFWSYPMLLTIALGTWQHHKRQIRSAAATF